MDELIRERLREALDAIPPPPNMRALNAVPAARAAPRSTQSMKFEWALGAIAALLALALVAGLLYARGPHHTVPSNPSVHTTPLRPMGGMLSPTSGWTTGPGGRVFRTADGGRDWKDVTPTGYASNSVSPYFYDAQNAWITADVGATSTLVWRTSDGGASWQRGEAFKVAGLHGRGPTTLFFFDAENGWLLGSSVNPVSPADLSAFEFEFLYRTSDGGIHWRLVADTRTHSPGCPWADVSFSSRTTGWMTTACTPSGGSPGLIASRDGGATWVSQALPVTLTPGAFLFAPTFFDAADGILASQDPGSHVTLFSTSDGGRSWNQREVPGEVQLDGGFFDAQHGWLVAGSSDLLKNDSSLAGVPLPLYRTDDGGSTWRKVTTNLTLVTTRGRIQGLYFVNQQVGFAVAVGTAVAYGSAPVSLFASSDGGATWNPLGSMPGQVPPCLGSC